MSAEPDAFDKDAIALRDRLIRIADELREFSDSVVIVCTICEGDSSQMVWQKRGNVYASIQSTERVGELLERQLDEVNGAADA
jgi:hypothetical protein